MTKAYSFIKKFGLELLPNNRSSKASKVSEVLKRPFGIENLRSTPESWRVRPPDFVGIASGKAGTTWWYQLLLEHPSVEPNRLNRKELSYFYHFGYGGIGARNISTYRQAFAAPQGSICGEWSPGYLNFPFAVDYLAETAPEAKLLAIVRNPVDRVVSAQNQQLSKRAKFMNLKGSRAYIYKTFSIFESVIFNSFLYSPFKQLLRNFDRDQLLLLQYEKCKMDPAAEIAKTYRFLGIDDTYIPKSLNREVNKSAYLIPKPQEYQRGLLADYYREDVNSFVNLFPGIDLSLWPDFEGQ